ncbi:MAG: prepilin-type N-terminal cleavage/methylation domain-containing protein [Phycisphaerales bacterium]|nr:MAG: prepilin-type N-terminal cleavage/methylation domain-containing protein [Phycisphaerales bacterium]
MQDTGYSRGFSLVELLLAMVVTGVILTAVVALAFALKTADDVTDDMSEKQAQVRFATLRISELIRHCKLICGTPGNSLAVWRSDDNDDGLINTREIVLIERGIGADLLRLCEFPSSDTSTVNLSNITALDPDVYSVTYVTLIPQCSDVQFSLDASPPHTKLVSISFDLVENNVVRRYQINATLLCWAGNLLNTDGDALVSDDDWK